MAQKGKLFYIVITVALAAAVGIAGFFLGRMTGQTSPQEQPPESTEAITEPVKAASVDLEDERTLRLDMEVSEDAYTEFTPDQLSGNIDGTLTYVDVTNVSIAVDGSVLHLEDAIRDGRISLEELVASARIDARHGFCEEKTKTKHSLTIFLYQYPEFDLRVIYDVYKSPDGTEHLLKDFDVCADANTYVSIFTDDAGNRLDQEDWGLAIEVVACSPCSITLWCTQSGGQQIGQLVADFFYLDHAGPHTEESAVPLLEGVVSTEQFHPKPIIQRNATSEITLDWTNLYGTLAPGDYVMTLKVTDKYDPADVHPLMENFVDTESFLLEFTVP